MGKRVLGKWTKIGERFNIFELSSKKCFIKDDCQGSK